MKITHTKKIPTQLNHRLVLANREVQNLLNGECLGSKRGQYTKYSDDERVKVGK